MTPSREIRLISRPAGQPEPANFALADVDIPDPRDGQVLVRNLFMSVDPYMRGRMNEVSCFLPAPPFQLGKPLDGGAIGEFVESTVDGFTTGDTVLHGLGWREHALLPATGLRRADPSLG